MPLIYKATHYKTVLLSILKTLYPQTLGANSCASITNLELRNNLEQHVFYFYCTQAGSSPICHRDILHQGFRPLVIDGEARVVFRTLVEIVWRDTKNRDENKLALSKRSTKFWKFFLAVNRDIKMSCESAPEVKVSRDAVPVKESLPVRRSG